jgi:hypothetical protein
MPANKILERAAAFNPDGFGFCTQNKLYKSLSFFDFIKELKKVKMSESCIIHFRYATAGSVKLSNCHPFSSNNVYFAHNGVLRIATRNDMTDSEIFFNEVVLPAIDEYGYGSGELHDALSNCAGLSKFALMNADDGDIMLVGKYERFDGCYYSNLRFL